MERMDRQFASSLAPFSVAMLDRLANVAYATDADLRLRYLNPAWFDFADDNGGLGTVTRRFGLGCDLPAAVQGDELRLALDLVWRRSLASGLSWEYDYECSSDETFRLFRQQVIPLAGGRGLLFVNHQRVEQPHERDRARVLAPRLEHYRTADGLIAQCSYCRRVRRAAPPDRWDWVPVWVAQVPPQATHTICPVCRERYFQALR